MIRSSVGLLAILVGAACVFAPGGLACTVHEVSQQGEAEAFDEAPMLAHLAEAVALPMFRAAATETKALALAAVALEQDPTASTLGAARAAWLRARATWSRTLVFGFGPSKNASPRIDWWPTDSTKIDARVAGALPIDAADVAKLGSSERGFGAVEWLLFGEGDDASALALLDAEPRRRALIRALADDLALEADALRLAWEPTGGDFAGELATAGAGSATYPARKNATDAIVNESIFVVELVLGNELALPLGLRNGGAPQPASVRSPWSGASVDDALAHLDGFAAIYRGGLDPEGVPVDAEGGLSDLVVARGDAELDADVRASLTRARAAVAAIPSPLAEAVTASPGSVQLAYDEVRELKRLLSADLATAVGTTLSFNDNDGD